MNSEVLLNNLYYKFDPEQTNYTFTYIETVHTKSNKVRHLIEIYCHIHKVTATAYYDQLMSDIPKWKYCCPICHPERINNKFKIDSWDAFKDIIKERFPLTVAYLNKLTFLTDIKDFDYNCIVKVKCSEHGEFSTVAKYMLLFGRLCPGCAHYRLWDARGRKTDTDVIADANKVHYNKYDYSRLHYTGPRDKMEIICHVKDRFGNEHSSFFQTYNKHISQKEGCPKCAVNASRLETDLEHYLLTHNIEYVTQHRFDFAKTLPVDFYFPQYNAVIECQGRQHFIHDCRFFHSTEEEHRILIERDERKYKLLTDNGYRVLYYATCEIPDEFTVKHTYYADINKLINELKSCNK